MDIFWIVVVVVAAAIIIHHVVREETRCPKCRGELTEVGYDWKKRCDDCGWSNYIDGEQRMHRMFIETLSSYQDSRGTEYSVDGPYATNGGEVTFETGRDTRYSEESDTTEKYMVVTRNSNDQGWVIEVTPRTSYYFDDEEHASRTARKVLKLLGGEYVARERRNAVAEWIREYAGEQRYIDMDSTDIEIALEKLRSKS